MGAKAKGHEGPCRNVVSARAKSKAGRPELLVRRETSLPAYLFLEVFFVTLGHERADPGEQQLREKIHCDCIDKEDEERTHDKNNKNSERKQIKDITRGVCMCQDAWYPSSSAAYLPVLHGARSLRDSRRGVMKGGTQESEENSCVCAARKRKKYKHGAYPPRVMLWVKKCTRQSQRRQASVLHV